MRRRGARRRRPSGRGRRIRLAHYGVVLGLCLLVSFLLFLIFIGFQGLSTAQLPRGLR